MSTEALITPHYSLVPKDLKDNIAFRRELLKMGEDGTKRDRQELWTMCSQDILFWWNVYAWTYDPRRDEGMRDIPFVTHPFQDPVILEINKSITEKYDLLTKKSRDMGASWMSIGVPTYRCLFKHGESHLMLSWKEDKVDKTNDPDALLWKVDFILSHLPEWMRQPQERMHLHIGFPGTNSRIDGESTTGNVGRGGKRTSILLDEFAIVENGDEVLAATRGNSPARHLNSTPRGMGNAYAKKAHDGTTKQLRLHWSEHPEYRKGLYTSEKGKLKILDESFVFPEDFKFIRDGELRSPWYDEECRRAGDKHEIAQELNIDFMGSAFQYFDPMSVQRHIEEFAQEPYIQATIEFIEETGVLQRYFPDENGPLSLWIMPDVNGDIPGTDEFVAGTDISAGTGASNSVTTFWNKRTREKVAELVTPNMTPTEFAYATHALLKWFHGARIIWEANGPGREFSKVLVEKCGYRNIYYAVNEDMLAPKPTDKPGWWATAQTKLSLMGAYRHEIGSREIANRSKAALEEMLFYVFSNNSVEHSGAVTSSDPSGARENHGDRVVADALVVTKLLGPARRKDSVEAEVIANPPQASIAGRRKARQEELLAGNLLW